MDASDLLLVRCALGPQEMSVACAWCAWECERRARMWVWRAGSVSEYLGHCGSHIWEIARSVSKLERLHESTVWEVDICAARGSPLCRPVIPFEGINCI